MNKNIYFTFRHIITNYKVSEWETIKKEMQPHIVYDINLFNPFFYDITDIQNKHYAKQFVYEVLAEGRRFNKIAVFIVDTLKDLEKLKADEKRIIIDSTFPILK